MEGLGHIIPEQTPVQQRAGEGKAGKIGKSNKESVDMARDARAGEVRSALRCCSHGMGPHSVFAAQQPRVEALFSVLPPT